MGFGIVLPAQQFPLAATMAQPRRSGWGGRKKSLGRAGGCSGRKKKRRGELQGSNPVAF